MTDKEFILGILAMDANKYLLISSREKLIAYTISFLSEKNIQTSFNNICIAAFKLFPEKFKFSNEFSDYPHIEMLNRTLLHILPKQLDYATGSARIDYKLTKVGEIIAKQVVNDLDGGKGNYKKVNESIDKHKTGQLNDYKTLKDFLIKFKNEIFLNDLALIWQFFKVTPHTQINKITNKLEKIEQYSTYVKDDETTVIVKKLIKTLK
jgi:hypothetical protein